MSSSDTGNNLHDKPLKKRKKKWSSPFRIKVGCLVALRYQSKGNRISVLLPHTNPSISKSEDRVEEESTNVYREQVASAHFSEVWTDPRMGRDDGLALIGSRIRCFFPKGILSEPYNASSRLLEGTVVNIERDSEDKVTPKHLFSPESSSFLVDLLVDNKDNKTLGVMLPFLKRVDNDAQTNSPGKSLKESEQRRRQYEERIKGGKDKAVVQVLLSNCSLSHSPRGKGNPLEAKWVIRKRVLTKLIRREVSLPTMKSGAGDKKDENESQQKNLNDDCNTGKVAGKCGDEKPPTTALTSETMTVKKKQRKRELEATTSFNKDFSLPRYLGDGNDSTTQQEGNWRWEAGRFHNPFNALLADRPFSRSLLEKLSYNFVGEVVSIHPVQPQVSGRNSIDTLAMVSIRLLVLPEHTRSGRLAHHGPLDIFESDDLDFNHLCLEGAQKRDNMQRSNRTTKDQQDPTVRNVRNENILFQKCFFRVPIEELVIIERKIFRKYSDSNKSEEIRKERKEMKIQHSYSFSNDTYSCYHQANEKRDNFFHAFEQEKAEMHLCCRCRHFATVCKRLAGIPHPLCERCFDFLKRSDAAKREIYQRQKSKKYRCECHICVDRKNTDLLMDLADEVLESESNLGSTLSELECYSAHRDSGFIATRFVVKDMNPVDFSIHPSSLASFIHSTSSKPVTKIKSRVCKGTKRNNIKKSARTRSNIDCPKYDRSKSPTRLGEKRGLSIRDQGNIPTAISKIEPFRSTSARLLPYDVSNRKFDVSVAELYQWKMYRASIAIFPEKPRNLRQYRSIGNGKDSNCGDSDKKKLQGRAARAKQRRLLRDVSAWGVDVDTLAGREANIRFDRSNIHGWGVFTDIDIRQGEMIIEYRGELIGNAMAEKREEEYEAAKIGSDYMFRIDEHIVCDASKHGNVARFINASCTPNCFPKIIFLDGTKRIVVYAKRDIRAGEELSYDYKFDLEYDPEKRIPCICGAAECRGFLNWDQRYDILSSDVAAGSSGNKN